MSQITTGLRKILSYPWVYDLLQNVMGAKSFRKKFVLNYLNSDKTIRILDIGCGTARILELLNNVEYVGFDLSEQYIAEAKKRHHGKGTFHCALVTETNVSNYEKFDVVLALGLMHHLSDEEVKALAQLAKSSLKTTGKLITVDPAYSPSQNFISRYLVSKDRGQNVRDESGYSALLKEKFQTVKSIVSHQKWVPYTHCIIVSQNEDV